jgi:hypothetical protein
MRQGRNSSVILNSSLRLNQHSGFEWIHSDLFCASEAHFFLILIYSAPVCASVSKDILFAESESFEASEVMIFVDSDPFCTYEAMFFVDSEFFCACEATFALILIYCHLLCASEATLGADSESFSASEATLVVDCDSVGFSMCIRTNVFS